MDPAILGMDLVTVAIGSERKPKRPVTENTQKLDGRYMVLAMDPITLAMGLVALAMDPLTLAMGPAALGMDLVSLAMESCEFSYGFTCSGYGSCGLCSGTFMDPSDLNYESSDLRHGSGDLGYGTWRF